jgi:hypothetical protein
MDVQGRGILRDYVTQFSGFCQTAYQTISEKPLKDNIKDGIDKVNDFVAQYTTNFKIDKVIVDNCAPYASEAAAVAGGFLFAHGFNNLARGRKSGLLWAGLGLASLGYVVTQDPTNTRASTLFSATGLITIALQDKTINQYNSKPPRISPHMK